MKTNLRSRRAFFSAARKFAFTISFLTTIASGVAAQTNTFPSSGNAGAGTTSPDRKLEVLDSSNPQLRLTHTDNSAYTDFQVISSGQLVISPSGADVSIVKPISIGTAADAYRFYYSSEDNKRWSITTGVGGLFHIVQRGDGWADEGARFTINRSGNVGIGTPSPLGTLHTRGQFLFFDDVSGAISGGIYANALSSIAFTMWSGAGDFRIGTGVTDRSTGTGFTERLKILNSNGNVGIGTTSPTEKLHVSGNGKFTGNVTVDGTINAKYQDVAEWVPSREQLAAGTVVVLDQTKSNQVVSSNAAYDTRVAGVISSQPGIMLGERGPGKVAVATTGRVQIKVDADRAAIQIGDLLVTSDIPGVAMKSEPVNLGGVQIHRPGTIVGKALEPLAKGKGEILVLLSLQ